MDKLGNVIQKLILGFVDDIILHALNMLKSKFFKVNYLVLNVLC